MEENALDAFVLANMPTFAAVDYQRLLAMQDPQEQVTHILHMHNLGVRALTTYQLTQYLCCDLDQVRDPDLDKLLEQKLPHLAPGDPEVILSATMRVYKGHRDLFFMPEAYDAYWDTSTSPHRERAEAKAPFEYLAQAMLDQQMKRQPPPNGWSALAQELRKQHRKVLHIISYIGRYDFICVLAQDEQTYTCELHKGLQVQVSQRPLPQHTNLINGHFYWRNAKEEFLFAHPLEALRSNKAGKV